MPAISANLMLDAPEGVTPQTVSHELQSKLMGGSSEIVVPPRPGLVLNETVSPLRFGVKVGVGVEIAPPPVPRGLCAVVVSGPETGAVFELPAGDHVVGRAGDIGLHDQALSRRHACITVKDDGSVSVRDLGSANGTFVEGVKLSEDVVPVNLGTSVAFGETVVEIRDVEMEAAAIEPGEPGWINFVRPPRIVVGDKARQVVFPDEPQKAAKRPFPWASLLVPLLMGGMMAFLMHSPRYLLFMLAAPLMMIANMVVERRSGGQEARQDAATYDSRLAKAEAALSEAITDERHYAREQAPDAVAAYLAAVVPGRRL